jgi:hypothetical protein
LHHFGVPMAAAVSSLALILPAVLQHARSI